MVTIIFHSENNNRNYEGFHLKWTKTGPTCGEDFFMSDTDHTGVIETAGYPKVLSDSAYCVWTLSVKVGKTPEKLLCF